VFDLAESRVKRCRYLGQAGQFLIIVDAVVIISDSCRAIRVPTEYAATAKLAEIIAQYH
jgi:hypothetical protein